ncbi:LVIVD repeat-containing protein [Pyxidicoccus sp. MSG2]|uniref:LVIVD repeat-containing protein n=1 Tax=Pyxidicoccus sp. MSG2 TaxID=2996790 RepID=UPI00226E7171|nr:hypothetical protein [Pyxidicoccus sp. MSG2]MCY1015887.1 hypothetical protein [Pyxidicoccus sp. MSG2]
MTRLAPPFLRPLLSACVLSLSVLSGCDKAPDPVPDAGTSVPTEDSGTDAGSLPDWDGTYTELEERGDWLDRGRFAPCTFDSQSAPASLSCEDLARFDVSQCDPDALASVGASGVYLADLRAETRLSDGGTRISGLSAGFKLEVDGGGTLNNSPFRVRNTDGGAFFLSTERTFLNVTTVTALVGCKVPSPGLVTGCYARCRDGRFSQTGTFEAHRMTWPAGEAESSGGMRLVSEAPVPLGESVDVYVAREHAYVVSLPKFGRLGGLTVFDVKDRAHTVLKTTISLPGDNSWNGVWAKGDALYVASAATGVVLFDITDPASPRFVRSLPGGGDFGAHTVLVDGDRLYAMSGGQMLLVFDVSRPLEPVLRQSILPPPDGDLSSPHDAFAYGGRLYVSNSYGGYAVLDVTDLDNVRTLGTYVHGAYAHHSAVGTFAGCTIAFEGTEFNASHVRVLDVSSPERIVKIGEFRMRPVTSVHNMLLVGKRLYVAWYMDGVRVLDVSNPTRPRQVAHFNTFQESHPEASDIIFQGTYGIRVPGDGYVYTANVPRGLVILNEP